MRPRFSSPQALGSPWEGSPRVVAVFSSRKPRNVVGARGAKIQKYGRVYVKLAHRLATVPQMSATGSPYIFATSLRRCKSKRANPVGNNSIFWSSARIQQEIEIGKNRNYCNSDGARRILEKFLIEFKNDIERVKKPEEPRESPVDVTDVDSPPRIGIEARRCGARVKSLLGLTPNDEMGDHGVSHSLK